MQDLNDIIATVAANKKTPWRSAYEGLDEFEVRAYCDEAGVTLPDFEAVYAMPVAELVKWAEGRAAEIEAVMGDLHARAEASGDYEAWNAASSAQESYYRIAHAGEGWELRLCYAAEVGLRGDEMMLAAFGDAWE
jgi:hypothetical protein